MVQNFLDFYRADPHVQGAFQHDFVHFFAATGYQCCEVQHEPRVGVNPCGACDYFTVGKIDVDLPEFRVESMETGLALVEKFFEVLDCFFANRHAPERRLPYAVASLDKGYRG